MNVWIVYYDEAGSNEGVQGVFRSREDAEEFVEEEMEFHYTDKEVGENVTSYQFKNEESVLYNEEVTVTGYLLR